MINYDGEGAYPDSRFIAPQAAFDAEDVLVWAIFLAVVMVGILAKVPLPR